MKATLLKSKHNLTTAPIEIPPRVVMMTIEPETIRLPRPGQLCPYSGLTRSALNMLILPGLWNDFKPPVKSYVLRQKGARTGIRLVSWSSLKVHIFAHEEKGE